MALTGMYVYVCGLALHWNAVCRGFNLLRTQNMINAALLQGSICGGLCNGAEAVMEVPERFYGSAAEGFKQLSEVLEVQLSPLSEAKPSDRLPLRLT